MSERVREKEKIERERERELDKRFVFRFVGNFLFLLLLFRIFKKNLFFFHNSCNSQNDIFAT